jgi:hypothetical protein
MAEARDPFEYVSWCDGPSVDISPLVDLPLCTDILYEDPTFDLHHVDMTLPDISPPQMCPCIWTFDTKAPGGTDIKFTGIDPASATAEIKVIPYKGEGQDCCDPTFNISFDLKLPCLAFSVTTDVTINIGRISFAATADVSNCRLRMSADISLPATSETVIVSIRVDAVNGFQVYKKTVKLYEVISDIGWETIISVGSCTTT